MRRHRRTLYAKNRNMEEKYVSTCFTFYRIGLLFLIKGGDWFVDGASALARRFPPAGAADWRDGRFAHRHNAAGGHGFHDVGGFRPRRDCLRQCHRLGHLQLGADRSHHDCRAPWQGSPQDAENAGVSSSSSPPPSTAWLPTALVNLPARWALSCWQCSWPTWSPTSGR